MEFCLGKKKKKMEIHMFLLWNGRSKEVIENSLIFNDDIWAAIYKDIKNISLK